MLYNNMVRFTFLMLWSPSGILLRTLSCVSKMECSVTLFVRRHVHLGMSTAD